MEFILTSFPSCSSALEPDLEAVSSFSFRDLFKPERRIKVPAITLDAAITEQGLGGIDWLKLDTQGLDLILIKSLAEASQEKLLAVEIEPGFIHAYKKESLFPECHDWMLENGFWLADLEMQRYAKIRPETQARLVKSHSINPSPFTRQLPGLADRGRGDLSARNHLVRGARAFSRNAGQGVRLLRPDQADRPRLRSLAALRDPLRHGRSRPSNAQPSRSAIRTPETPPRPAHPHPRQPRQTPHQKKRLSGMITSFFFAAVDERAKNPSGMRALLDW